jgi:heat shock protein HtpX
MESYLSQQKRSNELKTWFLMIIVTGVLVFLGYFLSKKFQNPLLLNGFMLFAIIQNLIAFWFSDKIALSSNNAKRIKEGEYPYFERVAMKISQTTNTPLPKLYVIEDKAPNAFATGRNKSHSAIAVTTGLLNILNEDELEGVVAHEFGHIQNKDILIGTVASVLIGLILMILHTFSYGTKDENGNQRSGLVIALIVSLLGPIVSQLIQLSISRKREFIADATAAINTHHPENLASALRKISEYARPMNNIDPATSHMFFANPYGKVKTLFMSHPPIEDRINALMGTDRNSGFK